MADIFPGPVGGESTLPQDKGELWQSAQRASTKTGLQGGGSMAILTHLSCGGNADVKIFEWDPKRQQVESHTGTSFQDGWKNAFFLSKITNGRGIGNTTHM